jgi:hypothetical protein
MKTHTRKLRERCQTPVLVKAFRADFVSISPQPEPWLHAAERFVAAQQAPSASNEGSSGV